MVHSFRDELVQELRQRFMRLAILLVIMVTGALLGLVLFIQNYQLTADTHTVGAEFLQQQTQADKLLRQLNRQVVPRFLSKPTSRRALEVEFYSQANKLATVPMLAVVDSKGVVYRSRDNLGGISPHYLETVVNKHAPQQHLTKVTRVGRQSYLLRFMRLDQRSAYSVLIMDAAAFDGTGIDYGSRYAVTDNFDNIYVANSRLFTKHDKFDSDQFTKAFTFKNGGLYLTRRLHLANNLSGAIFMRSFPLGSLALFFAASVLLTLGFMLWQANRTVRKIGDQTSVHITALVSETKKVRTGKQQQIAQMSNLEFQYLATSINEMMATQHLMAERELRMQKQANQFELKMLEAQFNPHFLSNTLENIRVAIALDPALADQLILSLNRVLRYSIDHSREFTTLAVDLEVLSDFLAVNQVRFEALVYHINMDPRLADLPVPRLFLLPLVENAIKYGMHCRADLQLTIDCQRDGHHARFTVSDNGQGFPPSMLINGVPKGNHHGMISSFRRLAMMYPHTEIHLAQSVAGGAEVSLESELDDV